jgi:CheY-like chemotaxis protein
LKSPVRIGAAAAACRRRGGPAFAAGFDHHLTKPVDTRQLNQLIES